MQNNLFKKINNNLIFIGFVIIVTAWIITHWNFLLLPIIWEEVDYVRFSRPEYQFTLEHLKHFFHFADGHPPLLSFPAGLLLRTAVPIWLLRIFIFSISLFGLFYCVKMAREFCTNKIVALTIISYIVFSAVHAPLWGGFIIDVLGMLYLFGWAYHRLKNEHRASLICLLISLGIRESHFLVPLAFIATYASLKPAKLKDCWIEFIGISMLVVYYLLCKIVSKELYPFTGTYQWNLENYLINFNIYDFEVMSRLLIPYSLSMLVLSLNNSTEKNIVFLTRRFYSLLLILAIFSLGPYLKDNTAPRLFSPFILIFLLPVFLLNNNPKKIVNYLVIILCTFSMTGLLFVDELFEARYFLVKHSQNSATLISKIKNISQVKDLSLVLDWPLIKYVENPNLRHISSPLHLNLIDSHAIEDMEALIKKIKNKPFMLVLRDKNKSDSSDKTIKALCFNGEKCSRFNVTFSNFDNITVYYRNIPEKVLMENFQSDGLELATKN